MSTATADTWERFLAVLEQLPPAPLDPLVTLYRDLRDQQQRRLPLLPDPPDEDAAQALATVITSADRYTDDAQAIANNLNDLRPTPIAVFCPEYGI